MKCIICGKKAKYRWSPDLDIQGIGACKTHQEDVQIAYIMLIQGSGDMFDDFISSKRNQWQKKSKVKTKI